MKDMIEAVWGKRYLQAVGENVNNRVEGTVFRKWMR